MKRRPSVSSVAGRHELSRLLKRPVSGGSIADEIVITLATDIIEGRLLPGDEVNSVELAKTFGSSRTPVREALFVLEREGFVKIPARRRPHIARHSLEEVREIYNLRAALYSMVSTEVVRVATAKDLDLVAAHQAALAKAVDDDDVDTYFWVNVQFRNAEADIGCGPTMRGMLDMLGLRALQLRHLSLSQPGRLRRSLADHARLLQAYEDRDATLASALTRSLVLSGFAAIESSGWNGDASWHP